MRPLLHHGHASRAVTLSSPHPCYCRRQAAASLSHCPGSVNRAAPPRVGSRSGGNGSTPSSQAGDDDDDPVAALLWAARESEGIARVAFDGNAAAEAEQDDLEDLLEDLEDPWMRFPSAPEWSEAPVFGGVATSSSSSNADSNADSSSLAGVGVPGRVATVTWQQLGDRLAVAPEQQQLVVVLEVLTEEQQLQEQSSSDTPQLAARPLPDPLPLIKLDRCTMVEVVRTPLAQLDRNAAERWRQQGAVVAVWNSGHHSCLAAAIRLSAVWRLGDAVVLVE